MPRRRIPAIYMRGGSSKGVFFHERDLPPDRAERDALFLEVLGSPDPYARQLNGMGGGVSSVSKAVIIEPSERDDADVDYTFAQVSVDRAEVDYSATCGNLSSAVGAFAVDEGLVDVPDGEVCVRVHNTNTGKVYHARFPVSGGQSVERGDFAIPGVAGTGARVTLDYVDPGGAATGKLLPTGRVREVLSVEGVGDVDVSMIDASAGVVFVEAEAMGLAGTESPDAIDADAGLMERLDRIRRAASVAMGISASATEAPLSAPRIALVSAPSEFRSIDGLANADAGHDLGIRILSMEKCHKAVTLTGAMCTAVAAQIEGSIPHALARTGASPLRIGNPSGVLPVAAAVVRRPDGSWHAETATVFRTQRRLMEGHVLVPEGTGATSKAAAA